MHAVIEIGVFFELESHLLIGQVMSSIIGSKDTTSTEYLVHLPFLENT